MTVLFVAPAGTEITIVPNVPDSVIAAAFVLVIFSVNVPG